MQECVEYLINKIQKIIELDTLTLNYYTMEDNAFKLLKEGIEKRNLMLRQLEEIKQGNLI